MTWEQVNHKYHGVTAEVHESNWRRGMAKVMGVIRCESKGVVPCLVDGDQKVHMFARWFIVDIVD